MRMSSGILVISTLRSSKAKLILLVEHGAFDRPLLWICVTNPIKERQLSLLKVLPSVGLRHAILLRGRSVA